MARRRSWSMATRNAARVLPEPVGAEMRVVSPRRIAGQPSICGSVAEPNLARNHSATMGWAQARASAAWSGVSMISMAAAIDILYRADFAICLLDERDSGLVFGGHFYPVDDQDLDGAAGGFELEAQLLLDGGEDGGAGWGWGGGVGIGRPLDADVVFACDAGLVDDDAAEF